MNQESYIKEINHCLSKKDDELLTGLKAYRSKSIQDQDAAFIEVEIDIELLGNYFPFGFSIIYLDNCVDQLIDYESLPSESQFLSSQLISDELHDYDKYSFDIEPILRNQISKWFVKIWNTETNLINIPIFITTHDLGLWYDVKNMKWTENPLKTDTLGNWIK